MHILSLGWEDPLEEEMATHSSILVWSIPWTEEPGGRQSMGWQRVGQTEQAHTHTTCSRPRALRAPQLPPLTALSPGPSPGPELQLKSSCSLCLGIGIPSGAWPPSLPTPHP